MPKRSRIDTVQRGYAKAIVRGCSLEALPDDASPKARSTGLMARTVLGPVSLEEIRANMAVHQFKDTNQLSAWLGLSLTVQTSSVLFASDQSQLDKLFEQRQRMREDDSPQRHTARERTLSGTDAATLAVRLSLETIRHNTVNLRKPLKHEGLYASQCVPAILAMTALEGLNTTILGITKKLPLHFRNDAVGEVLRPSEYGFDTDDGLMLTGDYTRFADGIELHESTIGCPVTLLPGFTREFFAIAADAAVRSGLIPLSK